MGSAHFVLVGFASPREAAIIDWRGAAEAVGQLTAGDHVAVAVLPPTAGALVGWRLVASNSRVLARSTQFFGSEAEARTEIDVLLSHADELSTRLVAAPSLRGFGWLGVASDHAPFMSARWYEGRAIAQNAARLVVRTIEENATAWRMELPMLPRVDVSSAPRVLTRRR